MSPTAEITFAIPFYSGVDYLLEAIHGVRRQTVESWRVVVCDDAPEDTGAGARFRALNDPRVVYTRNEHNLGLAANWNRCLDRAETDLVTLLHADDVPAADYAERMIAAARRHPDAVACACRVVPINASSRPSFSAVDRVKTAFEPAFKDGEVVLAGQTSIAALLRGNFIPCPTLCYRKSRLGTRRFDTRWRHVADLALTTELLLDGETIVLLSARAYRYRRHGDSATHRNTADLTRFRELDALYDRLSQSCEDRAWPVARRVAARKRFIKMSLMFNACADLAHARFAAAGRKLRYRMCLRDGESASE